MPRTLFFAVALPALLTVVAALFPMGLPPGYHDFADHARLGGLQPFGDVASNATFLVAGAFVWIRAQTAPERVLAVALVATCFGSAFYHLNPGDARLLIDRLPMAPAFAAMAAIVLFEDDEAAGLLFTAALTLAFAVAAAYALGTGNQAFFVAGQVYVLILVLSAAVHPEKRLAAFATFALYVAAKLTETFDHQVLHITGFVSGHTLKHLMAGLAPILWFALWERETEQPLAKLRYLS